MALTVAAYVAAARPGGPAVEGTTEVAALTVLALGTIAGLGLPAGDQRAASRSWCSPSSRRPGSTQIIRRIGQREISAALQFAVLALVILPLLPTGPYGPFDSIRPRALWTVVLLFSGLNFLGYLARGAVGETRGLRHDRPPGRSHLVHRGDVELSRATAAASRRSVPGWPRESWRRVPCCLCASRS